MAVGDVLLGVRSNKDYLAEILATEVFASGDFSTSFVGQQFPQERIAAAQPSSRLWLLAAVALYLDDARKLAEEHGLGDEMLGWHSSHESPVDISLRWGSLDRELEVQARGGRSFEAVVAGGRGASSGPARPSIHMRRFDSGVVCMEIAISALPFPIKRSAKAAVKADPSPDSTCLGVTTWPIPNGPVLPSESPPVLAR